MKTVLMTILVVWLAIAAVAAVDAPTGFDNKSNGIVDDKTHQADLDKFDEVEQIADGLGPLYNAQSCVTAANRPTRRSASRGSLPRSGKICSSS